jgi:hypothetical protein
MFTRHAHALRAAKAMAAELAVGRAEVHTLTGHELVDYRRAVRALNGTGVDLDVAVAQFAQATRLLDDVTVMEAANVYKARKGPLVKRKLVSVMAVGASECHVSA